MMQMVDAPYVWHVTLRAVLLWVPARAVLLGLALAFGLPAYPLAPVALLLLAVAVAAMCMVDARFMRESVFRANLGTPTWTPAAVAVVVVLAGEAVIAALAAFAAFTTAVL
jgi:hypothetical protein